MLHKEIPFLRIGLPLCGGIVSGLYFQPDITFLAIAFIVIISGFIISLFFNKYRDNLVFGIALSASFFLCGILLYANEKNMLSSLKSEKTTFIGTLSDYPEEKEKSYILKVKLDLKVEASESEPVNGSIILYNKKDSTISSLIPGDVLIFRCTPIDIINKGNPYEFDYRFFMENQGIRYYAFTKNKDFLRHIIPNHRKLMHKALIVREKIISMFRQRGLKGERLALVSAITLGQKSMLDPEQKLNFMKAGVMHIMAVSGLHAIILSLFVFNLLFFMKGRFNMLRILITILILWAFAFITGLTPSVLRATLMYSFLQAGKLMKRPANGINSVLASAFVLIILKPSVIFDAGFLLSYSAVIYIMSFYSGFYQIFLFKNWLVDKIWQSAVVTIVAQAGTLPLTIALFNRFPTYFILANITIVPISNLLIIVGCLIPMFFPIYFLSKFLAILLSWLTGLTEDLTALAASLPFSTIENIGMTYSECILLTCTIFLFSNWLFNNKSHSIYYPAVFLILFLVSGMLKDISSKITDEIIVYNTPGTTTIGIRSGKKLNLLSDTSLIRPEVYRHCATLGLKISSTVLAQKCNCLEVAGKKILITEILNNKIIQNYTPDIVILNGNKPLMEYNFTFRHPTELLIVISSATSGIRFSQHSGPGAIDSIHFVKKSGAFSMRL